jgi:hypothetical protein
VVNTPRIDERRQVLGKVISIGRFESGSKDNDEQMSDGAKGLGSQTT